MIDESLRDATVIDRGGYAYLVHPLTDGVPRVPPGLLREWTAWAKARPCLRDVDLLVAPEAMALPLAAALSLAIDVPFVIMRKRPYGLPGERHLPARTGYGSSNLHLNDVRPGERVVVVEDVLSTGGTLEAVVDLVRAAGAVVAGVLVFLEKDGAAARAAERLGVPIEAMRGVRVEAGRVVPGPAPAG